MIEQVKNSSECLRGIKEEDCYYRSVVYWSQWLDAKVLPEMADGENRTSKHGGMEHGERVGNESVATGFLHPPLFDGIQHRCRFRGECVRGQRWVACAEFILGQFFGHCEDKEFNDEV